MAYWIKILYERNTHVIDLDRVTAFCYLPNNRISLALLDGNTTIVINQQTDSVAYQTLLDYIKQRTGFSLP